MQYLWDMNILFILCLLLTPNQTPPRLGREIDNIPNKLMDTQYIIYITVWLSISTYPYRR